MRGGRTQKASNSFRSRKSQSRQSQSKRKSQSKKSQSGRKLNEYFKLMLGAKKKNLTEFKYKNNTYKQKKTKTGLLTYSKQ